VCSIQAAGLALSAVSAVTSFMGGRAAAKSAKSQGEYQAAVARNNQVLAERAATDARKRGDAAAKSARQDTEKLKGRQRAVLAANGVVVDRDSALDITGETSEIGELDALTIRNNAEREAVGLEQQGQNFGSEAQMRLATGMGEASAARVNSFGTFLGNSSRVADRWYSYRSEGVSIFG